MSVVERDAPALGVSAAPGAALLEPFAQALAAAGLSVIGPGPAAGSDIAELGSSWAKRLGIPARRPAWTLTARAA